MLPTDNMPKAHTERWLPSQATYLVGREQELHDAASKMMQTDVRLLTMTGPGGTGKTRLALALDEMLASDFADGVAFIDLSVIGDPNLVAPTLAQTLGISQSGKETLLELLRHTLQGREQLILIDNFEQVMLAAGLLDDILSTCSRLKLLVTSRSTLKLSWEHEFAVLPLALPNLKALPPPEVLQEVPSVELFVRRAQAARTDFRLTPENAPAVAQLCHHLDGLPLALELAAPRIKLLSPEVLLNHLAQHSDLLTRRLANVPHRQRTLRAEIAWSYDLLSANEQRLFCRLSVFVGEFSLASAVAVCKDITVDVFEDLTVLVDHSLLLVYPRADETRFRMLLTIREFAEGCLQQLQGDYLRARELHGEYYAAFVETWGEKLWGADQKPALQHLEKEVDNIRAAWEWAVTTKRTGFLSRSARLLCIYFDVSGRYRDGLTLADSAIKALEPELRDHHPALGRALTMHACLHKGLGDFVTASRSADLALALLRPLDDVWGVVTALTVQVFALVVGGEYERAEVLCQEALRLVEGYREDARVGAAEIAELVAILGLVAPWLGDYDAAEAYCLRALSLARAAEHHAAEANVLYHLGFIKTYQGDANSGKTSHTKGLTLAREAGYKRIVPAMLSALSLPTFSLGKYKEAESLCEESLALAEESGDLLAQTVALTFLGRAQAARGRYIEAQEALERSLEVALAMRSPTFITGVFLPFTELRHRQGVPLQALLWAEMTRHHPILPYFREQALKLAEEIRSTLPYGAVAQVTERAGQVTLEELPRILWEQRGASSAGPEALSHPETSFLEWPGSPLTARELEVLKLITSGITNKEIGLALAISEKTVARHVDNIFNKLSVSSRASAAAFAVRNNLA